MSQTPNVSALLGSAQKAGDLSKEAAAALNVVDLGARIEAAMGVPAEDVDASEVVLVTLLIDDSGSIRMVHGNSQAIRDGHNLIIESLRASKQSAAVLVHTRYLNGEILYPYRAIDQAVEMDSHNYNPNGGTPLYDESVVTLGTVMAKAAEFSNAGVPVRTITLILTDGADQGSYRQTASSVSKIVADMLRLETHIVAAMGVDDGATDFRQVFEEMGIRPEWILTPGNTPSDIRKACGVFSKSAVRASQTAASFSQTALGGFAG